MADIEKLDGKSMDIENENIEKLKEIFPDVFSEGKVDFEALEATLGEHVDRDDERYSFNWSGKAKARRIAQTPSAGTLRPAKEESKDWDTTENLYIEGDNLEVLKLLQKSYHKQVKMIYIDPPYNTGKDFVYKDNFKDNIKNYLEQTGQVDSEGNKLSTNSDTSGRYHSDWLNMMYPRLKLARNLLKDDGVIFISIDDNEVVNLRKLCDEIFGEGNFIGNIVYQTATDNNPSLVNTEHEYILVYAKNKDHLGVWFRKSDAAELIITQYEKLKKKFQDDIESIQKELRAWIKKNKERLPKVTHYDNVDEKGVFHDADVANTKFGGYEYEVIHPKTGLPCKIPDKGFRFPQGTMQKLIRKNEILFGGDETVLIKPKKRVENVTDALRSIIYEDGRASTKVVDALIGRGVFDNPKSHMVLERLIDFVSEKDDTILDFFAGSGTTSHAVMSLNAKDDGKRRCISIQLPELTDTKSTAHKAGYHNIAEISKERMHRAGELVKEESAKEDLDIGFKVLKLDSSNIKEWDLESDDLQQNLWDSVENIKSDRTEEDLLYEILLKYGLDLTLPIEELVLAGKKVYVVGLGALVICLDEQITLDTVEEIAKLKEKYEADDLMRVVFRDNGFKDAEVKTNAIQILKQNGIDDVKSL